MVQFIFYFWSFEIRKNTYSEKSENVIGLDSYISNSLNYLNLIWFYNSYCFTLLLKLEIYCDYLAFIASSFRVTEED